MAVLQMLLANVKLLLLRHVPSDCKPRVGKHRQSDTKTLLKSLLGPFSKSMFHIPRTVESKEKKSHVQPQKNCEERNKLNSQ